MNILYLFHELNGPMSQWQRTHFISELQNHACKIDCINPLAYRTAQESHNLLIKQIGSKKYDLFFTNVCNENELLPETIQEIKRMGVPTLCLRCDNLVIPFSDKILAPYFDLVWLTSKETQRFYNKWGVKTVFAPYAANPISFNYKAPSQLNRNVCFIGTPYGSRAAMMNALTSKGVETDVYYKKNEGQAISSDFSQVIVRESTSPGRMVELTRRLFFPEGRRLLQGALVNKLAGQVSIYASDHLHEFSVVNPDKQSEVYSEHTLCLASTSANHTDVLRHPLKIINLRNFEIPMSGGIEICRYNPELAEYFEEDKEILFYQDFEELCDKAKFYQKTAKDKAIYKMKESARKRAEGEHTWWHRFSKAFAQLGLSY